MKELKNKYTALTSLAKELMKRGNVSEYINVLSEISILKKQMIIVQ